MADKVEPFSILIVEDDPNTRTLLRHTLSREGFDVATAGNGSAGLAELDQRSFDLVLCDVMMSGMDGFAFREKIQENPRLRDLPFVFLTAKSQALDQIRGLRLGADEYITKPFDPPVLVARIEAVLQRREAYDRMAQQDSLTGLLNRAGFEKAVAKELMRLKRYGGVGSFALLDIDDFKTVNDTFGHAAGDAVLKALSDVIVKCCRELDIAGRHGGEEFVIFMPGTPKIQACIGIERIQIELAAIQWDHGSEPITLSAGAAEATADGETFAELCEKADQAMYAAKRAGKARALPWTDQLGEPADGGTDS